MVLGVDKKQVLQGHINVDMERSEREKERHGRMSGLGRVKGA